jgi:hypothetical protein
MTNKYSISIEQIPPEYWRDEKLIAYAFYTANFITTIDLLTHTVYNGSGLETDSDILKYHNNLIRVIGLDNLQLVNKFIKDGYIIKAVINHLHKTMIELVHVIELNKSFNVFSYYPMLEYIGLHKL